MEKKAGRNGMEDRRKAGVQVGKGRIMIAGTKSGCGKTTLTCGILYGLKKKGASVQAFKCGPDYIDPMFHSRVLGIPSGNLDSYFCGRDTLLSLLAERCADADIGVIEGAMGYYDGIGMSVRGSSWEIGSMTGTPAVLVVDAGGMGNSVLALLKGFLEFREDTGIAGVIFNQMSPSLYEKVSEAAGRMGVRPLGYVPMQKEFCLENRHLGLVTAEEVPHIERKLEGLFRILEKTLDWDGIVETAASAEDVSPVYALCPGRKSDAMVAVARDSAFSFLYEDNVRYLEKRGCRIVYFSPMKDKKLPDGIGGLILCGGYPELYARELSANRELLSGIRQAVLSGLPCIAECGGFLYLHEILEAADGKEYPMAGVLPGKGFPAGGLKRFGYIRGETEKESLLGKKGTVFCAHEFHYWDSDLPDGDLHVIKASGEAQWRAGVLGETLYAGFPHLYFYGNETLAEAFLRKAEAFQRKGD